MYIPFLIDDALSSVSLLVELLGAFAFAFEATEMGAVAGFVVTDGFFLASSDESDDDDVSCFFLLAAAFTGVVTIGFFANGVIGVVGAIRLDKVKENSNE